VEAIVPDGEKNTWWGRIVLVGALWAMIGPGLFGILSDRCQSRFGRRRPFIAIGGALTGLALMFLGSANQVWMFFVGYLLVQVSDDVAMGPYSAIVPEYVPEKSRGKAAGIMGLLKLLAQLVAAGVGVVLAEKVMGLYVVMALLNVACALWVFFTIKEVPFVRTVGQEKFDPMKALRNFWSPFRKADFRWIWITSFLNAFGFYMILTYLRYYLGDKILPPMLESGSIVPKFIIESPLRATIVAAVIISLAGAVSALKAGKMVDRIGRKKVVVGAGWLMFGALIPFALISNYLVILALAVPFGIGYGAYISSDWALVSDVLGDDIEYGKNMGLWQMSVATPQVISGILGTLVDYLNKQWTGQYYGYTVIFMIASFGFLFGSTLVKRIKGSS
ncbi:MAG: MFS transporter, partial [Fimbriimonadaceae bacterium]